MNKININTWERKDHYLNFVQFEDPFFNICADVEVTNLKKYCGEHEVSFFIASYFTMLKVVNAIEAFKYRIRDDDVVVHEKIRGSCPIMREDGTFAYGYFDYIEELESFIPMAQQVIIEIKQGAPFDPKFDEDDLIHSSVIPWVSFKSIEHAKRLNKGDSIPKIVFGKTYENNSKVFMPISVSGHHALMDGFHAGEFFQEYEKNCSEF